MFTCGEKKPAFKNNNFQLKPKTGNDSRNRPCLGILLPPFGGDKRGGLWYR